MAERGVLTEAIIGANAGWTSIVENHIFGKATYPHYLRAKEYMDQAGMDYDYHDVVKHPRSLIKVLSCVKPIVGIKTPGSVNHLT